MILALLILLFFTPASLFYWHSIERSLLVESSPKSIG